MSVEEENGKQLYENGILSGGFLICLAGEIMRSDLLLENDRLKIRFETPVRLKTSFGRDKKSLVTGMNEPADFRVMLKSLYHREFMINQLYGEGVWQEAYDSRTLPLFGDEVKIDCSHAFWYDWERFSNRQKRRMKRGGLMGR